MDIFSKVIFPIFGMIIILFAVGAYFFSYGANIKDKIQKFDFLGINLEISVITAIIIGGLLFCGIGIYLNQNDMQKKYNEALLEDDKKKIEIDRITNQKQELSDMLNMYRSQTISYYFVLDDIPDDIAPPPAEKLSCIFYKNWREKNDSTIYRVKTGANGYKVTFANLSLEQMLDAAPVLYLVDNVSKKRWVINSFNPLSPTLLLHPED